MSEQGENLERVSERIAGTVTDFCRPYAGTVRTFFADELRRYVREQVGIVAPGSPDRVLRDLRQRKVLDYIVVSRSESIYRVLWVAGADGGDGGTGGGMKQLTNAESAALEELEQVIERGLTNFLGVGQALARISKERLYRAAYKTFEEYCRERWKMSRSYAYRMIDAAQVVENLSPIGDKPKSEAQCRELAALPPEQQREVAAAVDFAHATAAEIRERAGEKTETMTPKASAERVARGSISPLEERLLAASALPQPITRLELYACLGSTASLKNASHQWDRALTLVPWLRVEQLARGKVRLKVDYGLKEICDRRRRGGALPGEIFDGLYRELMRRQKETEYIDSKRVWKPDAVSKADLIAILVWIGGELQNHSHGPSVPGRGKAVPSSPWGRENHHDSKVDVHTASADAGAGTGVSEYAAGGGGASSQAKEAEGLSGSLAQRNL